MSYRLALGCRKSIGKVDWSLGHTRSSKRAGTMPRRFLTGMALLAMAGFASWQWHNVPSPDDVESSAPVMGNEVVRLHLPEQEPQKLDYATNESGYISSTSPATPLASTSELLTPPLSGPVSSRLDSGAATEDEAATSPRSREGESEPLSRTVAVVERGDSLYKIFKEWNLPLQLLPALVESGEAEKGQR